MSIDQSVRDDLEASLGPGALSGDDAPNGHNILGAMNAIQRILSNAEEYSQTVSDLPDAADRDMVRED